MYIQVVSLFPDLVRAIALYGVTSRALRSGRLKLGLQDPRAFADDVHRTVDDRPYGGGPGMVLKYQPVAAAIQAARAALPRGSPVIYLSPQGPRLDQARLENLASETALVLLCGRYEGIDQRLIETQVDQELSIGDYVLSGGEPAAMVVIDALVRQLPGVLGDEQSAAQDSFAEGLLDWPHYTRPREIAGRAVPGVLSSGDHAAIADWRRKQALGTTWEKRPDLLAFFKFSARDRRLLDEFKAEYTAARTASGAE